jgi:hypothetical protein
MVGATLLARPGKAGPTDGSRIGLAMAAHGPSRCQRQRSGRESCVRGTGMSYCVICGGQHDPDVGCFDGAGQAIRNIGLPRRPIQPRVKGYDSVAARKWRLWHGFLVAVVFASLLHRLVTAFAAP